MAWTSRLRALFRRKRLAQELDEELEFHLSMRQQWNEDRGVAVATARREARLRFGSPPLWRERMSEIDLATLPQTVLQDLRYGARILMRNAGFTIVAALALAMGIGLNTAAFTAYKAFFVRGLDARDPGKMVNMALLSQSGAIYAFSSYPDYAAFRDHLRSFSGVIAQYPDRLTLTGAGETISQRSAAAGSLMGRWGMLASGTQASTAEFASTFIVSENYFQVLGVRAIRGRTFAGMSRTELEATPAVLISENYWQRRFGSDPGLLGGSIRLNGAAFTVVGITPRDFAGTGIAVPDFWLPFSLESLVHPNGSLLDRENKCCRIFGRLAPGVTMATAQAEMTVFADQLRSMHNPHSEFGKPFTAQLQPGSPFPGKLDERLKFAVELIMVAVGLVLVIACANVASLQLARAASRQGELGMRLSLGASRLRLIRQLLTESVLLGVLSGAVALLFSWALLRAGVMIFSSELPAEYGSLVFNVNPDLQVFGYVFGLSVAAGILLGLAPALDSSRSALASALKANTEKVPLRKRRLRDALIAAQVSVSLALMIAGSMLIHSSIRALKMDTGYQDKRVVDLDLRFPDDPQYTAERRNALEHYLLSRLAALPGVVAMTHGLAPDGGGVRFAAVTTNGEKPTEHTAQAYLYYAHVEANYFQTLGIPLLFGRGFLAQAGRPEVSAILSESAARELWPGQNPLGRSLRLGTDGQFSPESEMLPDGPSYRVIGVVRDTRGIQIDNSDREKVYLPLPAERMNDSPLLIRTAGEPAQLVGSIGAVMASIDPNLMARISTLEQMLKDTEPFLAAAFSAGIATLVGVIGLLLASMGVYGTVSYMVVLRTREVGIRMALGAKKRDILGLMLQESAPPVLAGLAAGVVLAVGASYLLRGVLYGVSRVDGVSFGSVSLIVVAIALLATYLPSRRAMRVEPMAALRSE
jgi:predicted permease